MKKNSDKEIIEIQLKRKVRSHIDIRSRCHLDLPVVTFVPPNLDDGTPFPTTYWLTCPLLVQRVSSLEASGMVKVFDKIIQKKGNYRTLWEKRQRTYEEERRLLEVDSDHIPPEGGVGGTSDHIKCLHAHLADHLATRKNPIGQTIESLIGGTDCNVPCVETRDGKAKFNSEWKNKW